MSGKQTVECFRLGTGVINGNQSFIMSTFMDSVEEKKKTLLDLFSTKLWSEESKINLLVSDSVQPVWCGPAEDYCTEYII